MEHLFVVRHGSYYDYGANCDRIDSFGREQMERLGKVIRSILRQGSAYIVSSTAPRALDSSGVLAVELGLPSEFEQIPYLWSGLDSPEDSFYHDRNQDKLIAIVNERRDKADGLVVVSHLEVTDNFPSFFFQREFGINDSVPGIEKGQAVHIDLQKKSHQVIPGSA